MSALGIEPGPSAHMSEHASERLTTQQTELARQTDPFLQYAPNLVVNLIQVRTIGWPQVWWGEVWRQHFQEFDCIVIDFYIYATSKKDMDVTS